MSASKPKSPDLAAVRAALDGGVGTMAKHFLQYRGLARGANDSLDALAQRLIGYVEAGELTEGDLRALWREVREAGDKRVYLFKAVNSTAIRSLAPGCLQRVVASMDQAGVLVNAAQTTVNYSYVSDDRVRVSYSEPHRHYQSHPDEERFEWFTVPCVVVLEAERKTGFVTLAMDSPGYRHPHGRTSNEYFDYHRNAAVATLGTDLAPVQLHSALLKLDKADSERVRPGDARGKTETGMVMRMSAGSADLRDDPLFLTNATKLALREHGRFVWKKTASETGGDSKEPVLLRDIRAEIDAKTSMVRFPKHTLSQEMAYVLAEIRELL